MPSLQRPPAEKLASASPVVKAILSRYPMQAQPEYMLELTTYFAGLTADEQNFLADRDRGLSGNSDFLPTIHQCRKLLDERRLRWGVLPDYSHIARGPDGKPLVDTTPSKAQQPVYVQDRRGDRRLWKPEDDEAFARMRAGAEKANRMQAYAKWLGRGDAERGWQIIIDAVIDEPPEDWDPSQHPPQEQVA